jgi:hypothetical protein
MAARLAIALSAAAALALGMQPAHAAKPEVLVQFEIEVASFNDNLPELDAALLAVRTALAAELGRQFVFADWRVAAPDPAVARLGTLVLRLSADAATRPNPRIFVNWWGTGSSAGSSLRDLGFDPIEIYSPGDLNWDTNDRRAFETRVLGQTMAKMRTTAFREELLERFLKRLPLGSSIVPHATDRVIEIPVQWTELLLSPESQLVVLFDKSVDQTKREGMMTLSRIAARVGPQANPAAPPPAFAAALRGSITAASFDAVPIPLDAQQWNADLPELLSGATAACFISVYKPRDPLAADSDRFGL